VDTRHRVYYLVNLNQNHARSGWWSVGWDHFGFKYEANLNTLKTKIRSLKIRPCNEFDRFHEYYQMMVSCKKEEEETLRKLLKQLPDVNYIQLWRL
jgi:hypothetical protein